MYHDNDYYEIEDTNFGWENGVKRIEENNQNICGMRCNNIQSKKNNNSS